MTTAGDLLSSASAQLHGWGSTRDRVTPLAADITSGDTSFTVTATFGQAVGISPGVVEIDGEQLYVIAVDSTTGICQLAPGFGRGYNRTTSAAHTAGAPVISRPKFPRTELFKQLNEVIGGLFPDLFAVQTYTGVIRYPNNTYTLPGSPRFVIDAQWQDVLGRWRDARSFKLDVFDGSFRLGDMPMIGRPLRVLYAVEPSQFTAETDNFTVTGLPASCVDLLKLGIVANSMPGLDISRAQNTSVEQSDRSKVVPPFAGVNAAKYIEAEFQERLRNETASLRRQYRARIVRTW